MQYSQSKVHLNHRWQLQKVMDVKAKLPRCARQAADAISAYTQVKMADVPSLLKIPKSECPDIWIRLPKHKWPQIKVQHGRPSGSPWAKSVRSSSGRTIVVKAFREGSVGKTVWKKLPIWECLSVDLEEGLLLSVYVDDITNKTLTQCGKYLWKKSISFLDHENLGCTQRECETSKDTVTITEICLNTGSLEEQKKSYLVQGNLTQTSPHGPMMWKVVQR